MARYRRPKDVGFVYAIKPEVAAEDVFGALASILKEEGCVVRLRTDSYLIANYYTPGEREEISMHFYYWNGNQQKYSLLISRSRLPKKFLERIEDGLRQLA